MSSAAGTPGEQLRILLVRTSALGDVVLAIPVLAAVRRALPQARIGWVVDEAFAPLLAGHAQLDVLLPVPLRRWRQHRSRRASELLKFVRELRAFAPDLAIDLMGNHKGALLARLSGAPRRIGARRADRREPASAIWINERLGLERLHSVERGLELLRALGIDPDPIDFAPSDLACGRNRVPAGEYVYLHPGTAWPNKRYPAPLWGAVARQLGSALGLEIRVGAAAGEESLADEIVRASDGRASRFDAPALDDLAGLIRGARLVLAPDTGASHLARALGRPIVSVHGPTDPARHGPWGGGGREVHLQLPCSFCHRRMAEPKACLAGLAPERIVQSALELFAATAV